MTETPRRLRLFLWFLLVALPALIVPALLNVSAEHVVWHVFLFGFWSLFVVSLVGFTLGHVLKALGFRIDSDFAHVTIVATSIVGSRATFYDLAVPYLYS
jgi:hypothetical protein